MGESPLPVDSVSADFERGLREGVEALVRLGHRRFAFLCPLAEGQQAGAWPDLFRALLAEKGIAETGFDIIRCKHTIASAYAAATGILARTPDMRPTALIALNDPAAIGALRAAVEREIVVPRDLSIVAADDIPLSSFLPTSLSTIGQPIGEMARYAVELLADRIECTASGDRTIHEVFPTTFIPRESIGPAA
jgi:LacI family transcriptional regulator